MSKRKRSAPAPRKRSKLTVKGCLGIGGGLFVVCLVLYVISGGPQATQERNATRTAQAIAQAATDDFQRGLDQQSTATAVALSTLITYTPSPSPTITPTFTPSSTITDTPLASLTAVPTIVLTHPAEVTPLSERTYYVSKTANIRTCADTKCDSLGQLTTGDIITLTGAIEGTPVNGSNKWYRISYQGQDAYIHSSLVQSDKPLPVVPVQPVSPIVQPPPSNNNASASCPGFQFTCDQLTCAQAYACLAAGNQQLDGNGDGIPCNSQCS